MCTHNHLSAPWALILGALFTVSLASGAYAVDGVIEINQAKAVAGAVTPSDAAGFPVTLDAAGSYRLTGNLALPTASSVGIEVVSSNVTIDLNGFEIGCDSCASATGGGGVSAGLSYSNIVVRDGVVRNVGGNGIALLGGQNSVEDVRVIDARTIAGINIGDNCHVEGNTVEGSSLVGIIALARCTIANNVVDGSGSSGIVVSGNTVIRGNVSVNNGGNGVECSSSNCVIRDNVSENNTGDGIDAGASSIVAHNTSDSNGGDGIEALQSTVVDNIAISNTGFGLVGNANTGYGRNVLSFNNSNGAQVSGAALETDANICHGDLICP